MIATDYNGTAASSWPNETIDSTDNIQIVEFHDACQTAITVIDDCLRNWKEVEKDWEIEPRHFPFNCKKIENKLHLNCHPIVQKTSKNWMSRSQRLNNKRKMRIQRLYGKNQKNVQN